MRLSSSQYLSASTCFKQFEYAHIERLAVKPRLVRDALRRGTWIHRALEVYHQGGEWLVALMDLHEWAMDHGADGDQILRIHKEVEEIVSGYVDYWSQHGERWTCELAEDSLEATFGLHTITARLDGIMKTPTGRFIVENKSTSDIPSATWRCIDPQTAIQWVVCQANGIAVDGIIFNYLWTKIPPIPKWKKDGEPYAVTLNAVTTSRAFDRGVNTAFDLGPDQGTASQGQRADIERLRTKIVQDGAYYQRYVVYKQDQLLVGILRDVASTIRDLLAAEQHGHYRRLSNPLYCPRFCQFSQLCATELTTGRKAEVLREEEFVIADGVIEREGVGRP